MELLPELRSEDGEMSMDEQISKKAALVAVKDALMAWSYMPEWRDGKILEAIAELPSTQPTFDAMDTQYNLPIGTDCISRQQAIDALRNYLVGKNVPCDGTLTARLIENEVVNKLPSAQPEIIRCRECKFASGDSRICMKFDHSPIGELDFCSFAERREVNNESN